MDLKGLKLEEVLKLMKDARQIVNFHSVSW